MASPQNKMILSNGRFSGTSRRQLSEAFDAFMDSDQKNTLAVHFHGGLVSEDYAEREIADRLIPHYRNAGGCPLFVIWQSGLVETLKNNWQEIVKHDVVPILIERVMQFLIG